MSISDDADEKLVRKSLTNLVARLLSGGSGQYEAGHADVVFHQFSVEGAGQGVRICRYETDQHLCQVDTQIVADMLRLL